MPEPRFLDAVLRAEKHDYLYFCARADLSGYSDFARSYEQHLVNARRYQRALNQRKIYRSMGREAIFAAALGEPRP